MKPWDERLRAGLRRPATARHRRLFEELNPDLAHTPILDRPPTRPRPAAVLIGIRQTDDPTVVMTLRAPTMPSHAGQISLPGGTPNPDDESLRATALRELEEEVGIAASAVEVLGEFGPHYGGLGYVVTPVVALLDPSVRVVPCPREVAEAFEVPLRALIDPENHIVQPRRFNDIDYNMFAVPAYDTSGNYRNIWGLTAGILHTFAEAFADED
ncbi:MAG: CoA pyrophosphatase [Parvularcula sp.]|jgi:8-oxo-dGTP pyrophosphatase MutT (NUDIX family)|nr:CoA pyrophosphatase [Parvularcula sp.]